MCKGINNTLGLVVTAGQTVYTDASHLLTATDGRTDGRTESVTSYLHTTGH